MRKLLIILFFASCTPSMKKDQPVPIDPKVYDTIYVPIPKDTAVINHYYQ